MPAITQQYDGTIPSEITVTVPSGKNRYIQVLAGTPSATLGGSVTMDLTAGETVDVLLNMGIHSTRIIIPDYANNRVVQIDEDKTGWIERTSLTGVSMLRPYDISVDNRGRIYVANNVGGSGMGDNGIIRIDDINSSDSYLYPDSSVRTSTLYDYGITAIAVDINNEYLYYAASNSALYRASLSDNTTHEQLTTTGITGISGLAVADDGNLYIAGNSSMVAYVSTIFIYNPSIQSVTASVTESTITSLATPWDVLVKQPYIYVANLNGGTDSQVLQFSMSGLGLIAGYGTAYTTEGVSQGYFYGASRFLAIHNDRITIIDEAPASYQLSKIVFMDDINGSSWDTYGSYGSGTGEGIFDFFHSN